MLITSVLVMSLALQILAAILALSLMRTTGSRWAWMLIATALVLMATRRALTLTKVQLGAQANGDISAEFIALAISVCLVAGVALIRPLFERMQAVEGMLRRREQELRETLDRTPDGIVLVRDGRWVYVNDAMVLALGVDRAALLGRPVLDTVHEADRDRLCDGPLRPEGSGVASGRLEARFRGRGDDFFTMEIVEGPIIENDGRPSRLLLMRDMTERRKLESQLRQAQKMEAVGQLAGGLAHDFNNLLTISMAGTSFGRAGLADGSVERQSLDDVASAADRAAGITRQLLDFSRTTPGNVSVEDPGRLLESARTMLQRLVGENVTIEIELAPTLHFISIDRTQFDQVLLNLVVNARDAMPGGGRIRVAVGNAHVDAQHRPWADATVGHYAVISVEDEGQGMTAEVQARVFEPFFTTKALGRGTGLGLATSYAIARRAAGTLLVSSEVGRGSRFELWLPAASPDAAVMQAPVVRTRATGGTETILLVEDEPQLRQMSARTLRALGYEVLEAPDGAVALELLRGHKDGVRLLFSDVRMPGMSGLELASLALNMVPTLRILLTSGYAKELEGRDDIDLLIKPYPPDVLGQRVRRALDATPAPSAERA